MEHPGRPYAIPRLGTEEKPLWKDSPAPMLWMDDIMSSHPSIWTFFQRFEQDRAASFQLVASRLSTPLISELAVAQKFFSDFISDSN